MEAIKKKMAQLKDEKEDAVERAEEADRQKKEVEDKLDAVSTVFLFYHVCRIDIS